jgi:hypothetical protein
MYAIQHLEHPTIRVIAPVPAGYALIARRWNGIGQRRCLHQDQNRNESELRRPELPKAATPSSPSDSAGLPQLFGILFLVAHHNRRIGIATQGAPAPE